MRRTAPALGLFAVGLAIATTLTAPASAYCRATTCGREGTACDPPRESDCGIPLAWARTCAGFAVHDAGSSQVGTEDTRVLLRAAFDAWEYAPCPGGGLPAIHVEDLGLVECDRVEYNESAGNVNLVVFRDAFWPHEEGAHNIALTTVTFDTETGAIFDADIEINSFGYFVTIGDVTDQYDLPSVLTHEAGHFLGLAHTDDLDATMYAIYSQGSVEGRTLEVDDVNGVCAIYPPAELPPCNPIPRHGFSPACAGKQLEGDCALAAPVGRVVGSPGVDRRLLVGLAGLGLAVAARLRARSASRLRRGCPRGSPPPPRR